MQVIPACFTSEYDSWIPVAAVCHSSGLSFITETTTLMYNNELSMKLGIGTAQIGSAIIKTPQ